MPSLSLYRRLSALSRPRTYVGKMLFVAFVGTHVPLIGLILYFVFSTTSLAASWPLLVATLVATLVGTTLTMLPQRRLLAPVLRTSDALIGYVEGRRLPALPSGHADEAGRLMRNAQKTITELDRLLNDRAELLQVVSHDLRTPLTSMLMAEELADEELRQTTGDAAPATALDVDLLSEMLSTIGEAAQRQRALVDNVLTITQADLGRQKVVAERVALRDLVGPVEERLGPLARRRGLGFEVTYGTDADRSCTTDARKVKQVLSNLVANAIRFTAAPGRLEIHVDEHGVGDDAMLELAVRDDGPGLPENEQDRIFEPFQTLDEHTAGDEQGSGLGLWISRALTEAMGGRLTAESAPGEGATFRIRLPWTAPHDEEAPVPAFPAASSPPVDGRASSQRADTVPSPSSRAHR
jgi:signal transduction histidine kinase